MRVWTSFSRPLGRHTVLDPVLGNPFAPPGLLDPLALVVVVVVIVGLVDSYIVVQAHHTLRFRLLGHHHMAEEAVGQHTCLLLLVGSLWVQGQLVVERWIQAVWDPG